MERRLADVYGYLREHLAPRNAERHRLGEVFTSLELVDMMLDRLPGHIWRDPNRKWLDPAAGLGNFMVKVFERLFDGLAHKIRDEGERARHIVEKMLYLVDINAENNAISRRLLRELAPGAEVNVGVVNRRLGFLGEGQVLGQSHFDVIVGNPPYQSGRVRVARFTRKAKAEQAALGLTGEKSEGQLWLKFVQRALGTGPGAGLLKRGGYLLFVHPITWFKPDRAGGHALILSRQLEYIRVFRNFAARRYFSGHGIIHVAFYVLKNEPVSHKTLIEYEPVAADDEPWHDNLLLGAESILILKYNSIYDKIRRSGLPMLGESTDLRHRTLAACEDGGKHRLIRVIEESGKVQVVESDVAHANQKVAKLILGGIHRPVVLYDKDGKYGLYARGQRTYIVGEGLERLRDFFGTRLFTLLYDNVKYEQDFPKPALYPDVRGIKGAISDALLAKYFHFTEREMRAIRGQALPIEAGRVVKVDCK